MPFFQRVFSANMPCPSILVAPGQVLVLCSATSSSRREGSVALRVVLKEETQRVQLGWINDDGNLLLTHRFTHEDGDFHFEIDRQRMRSTQITVTGYTVMLDQSPGGSSSSSSNVSKSREAKRLKDNDGREGRNDYFHGESKDDTRNVKVARRNESPHDHTAGLKLYKKLASETRGSTLTSVIDSDYDMPQNYISFETCAISIFKGVWKGEFPQPNAVENRKWLVKSHGLMYIDEILGDGSEPKG